MPSLTRFVSIAAAGLWRRLIQRPAPAAAQSGARLESLGRLHLSPTHSLHLVRAPGRTLVIAVHPGGCALLESSPFEPVPAREPGACRLEAQHAR